MSAERAPGPAGETAIDIAGEWFARVRSGAMTTTEMRELDVWLARAPENAAAYRDVARGWEIAGAIRSDPGLLSIREAARRARPRRWIPIAAAAGVTVALAGGLTASGAWRALAFLEKPPAQSFSTGLGQRTTVTLADGSVVTLDTETALKTRVSGRKRLVMLEHGRAYFRVAKDPTRPFVVAADGKEVVAVGTAFDVRVDPGSFQVTLVDGKVRVEEEHARDGRRRGQSADMEAGQRLTARGGRDWIIGPVDLNKETSWHEGRLTFVDDPLGDVADELNRYSTKKIVIRDPEIERAPIVSVFRTGDVDGFVKLVVAYNFARVVGESESEIVLAAPQTDGGKKIERE